MIEFRPFGVRLVIDSPASQFDEAVADTCRGWEDHAALPGNDTDVVQLSFAFVDALPGRGAPIIAVEGRRIVVRGEGVDAWADADERRGTCLIAQDIPPNARRVRDEIVEPLILFLLTRCGMTPLHAAGFVVDDVAILLAGPSGIGKSCLALAAHRAGHRLLSDDTIYVSQMPHLRFRGLPRPIHVFSGDAPPDARAEHRIRAGKRKHAVRLSSDVAGPLAPVTARRGVLCVLRRGSSIALDRIDRDEARRLLGPIEPGFDLLSDDIAAVVDRLTTNGAWCLTLSDDPAAAIAVLDAQHGRLVASAVS